MQVVDSITLRAIATELAELQGARIEKIHLPSATEMVWGLRGHGGSARLFFSTRGRYARVHLTARRWENPAQPPMFCMLLRKHLEGSRILRIEQLGLERVLHIVATGRDELGDPTERALVAEVTGNHANLILLDAPEGKVLGSLRPVTVEMSRERQILPGLPYDPPPLAEGKIDPRQLSVEGLWSLLSVGGRLEATLLKGVHSLSRMAIAQILVDARLDPGRAADSLTEREAQTLAATWDRAMRNLERGWFALELATGKAWDYRVLYTGEEPPPSTHINRFLDRYYGDREEAERLENKRAQLLRLARERLKKLDERLSQLKSSAQDSDKAERYRQWGELLLTNGQGSAPGSEAVEVQNYYLPDCPTERIPLDPRFGVSENAQRYFKKYQKARGAQVTNERFITEIAQDLEYWQGIETAIAHATRLSDLLEIEQEISPPPPGRPVPKLESEPMRFRSSDGLEILVGRNNRQNDLVTLRLARPDDWWFHTRIIPGSHVLVKAPGGNLPERTKEEAAMLAAYFSRARESSGVPVIYTQRRHLKKPPASKPGFVTYSQERTLFVTPDESEVRRIGEASPHP